MKSSLLMLNGLTLSGLAQQQTTTLPLSEQDSILLTQSTPNLTANSTLEQQPKESPKVGKFAGNIYSGEYFTDSVYYDNTSAFWTGYNMQSYLYA